MEDMMEDIRVTTVEDGEEVTSKEEEALEVVTREVTTEEDSL